MNTEIRILDRDLRARPNLIGERGRLTTQHLASARVGAIGGAANRAARRLF